MAGANPGRYLFGLVGGCACRRRMAGTHWPSHPSYFDRPRQAGGNFGKAVFVRNVSGAAAELQWYGASGWFGSKPVKIGRPSIVPARCAAQIPLPIKLPFQTASYGPRWLVATTKCQLPDEINFIKLTPEAFGVQTAGFYRVFTPDTVGAGGIVLTDADLGGGAGCPFGRDRLDGSAAPALAETCSQLFADASLARDKAGVLNPQIART